MIKNLPQYRHRNLLFTMTASCLAIITADPAIAQSAPQSNGAREGDAPLGEIVVTAQKRAETSQKVPLAINAFGGDQLKQLGEVNVNTVAQLVPGFTVAPSFRGP